jgi:hypothetical protein
MVTTKLYIVQMYRWGDTERHNYTVGVYNNEKEAYRQAAEQYVFRGSMKYLPAVHTCFLNQGTQDFVFGQILNHEELQEKLDEYGIKPYEHKFKEGDIVITKDGIEAEVFDICYYSDVYYLCIGEKTIVVKEEDIQPYISEDEKKEIN